MGKMRVISTTWSLKEAKETADFFERNMIPTLVEHVEIRDGENVAHGYRVFVSAPDINKAESLMSTAPV